MSDYDRTVELINTAYDSAGKSSEQFAKYQDTIEYKLKQLSNTWEQLRIKILDSDFFKSILDLGNDILRTISNFDFKQVLAIGTIGLTLGKTIIFNFIEALKSGTMAIQTTWKQVMTSVFDTKGHRFFNFQGLSDSIKENLKENLKGFNVNTYLQGSSAILGARIANAPQLDRNLEIQKTQELQKQLQYYAQIAQKRTEITQQADRERAVNGSVTIETQRQLIQYHEKVEEKMKLLNQLREELGYETEITEENAGRLNQDLQANARNSNNFLGSVIGTNLITSLKDSLSSGITTALTMAISGADLSTVFRVGIVSALTSAIPRIVSMIMPILLNVLASPIGIAVVAGAIVAGIVHKVKDTNEKLAKIEIDRLKSVQKANEELQKQQETSIKEYSSRTQEKETLNKNLQRYKQLSEKAYLNTSETEEFKKIAESLNKEYPEIISTYDESTGALTVNTQALKNLNNTIQEQIDLERLKVNMSANQIVGNDINAMNALKRNTEDITAGIITAMNINGKTKASINSPADAQKLVFGYTFEGLPQKTVESITEEVQNLLNGVSLEQATQAGISENIYKVALNDSTEDFTNALKEAGLSLEEFTNKALTATRYQEAAYKNDLVKAERDRIEKAVLVSGEDIPETIAKVLSYTVSDNADKIKENVLQASNDYYKNVKDKDFVKAVSNWDFGTITKETGSIAKAKKAWESLGYSEFANNEKNLKAIEEIADSAYNDLSDNFKMAYEALGYKDADWENIRKNSTKLANIFKELTTYSMYAQDNKFLNGIDMDVIKENLPELMQFDQALNDYVGKTYQEYIDEIEASTEAIDNDVIKQATKDYLNTQDAIAKQWKQDLDYLTSIGITNIDTISQATARNLSKTIQDFNLSENQRNKLVDTINQTSKGLNQTQLDILYSIDLTQSYGELLSNSQDYIKSLVESGMNATEAAELFTQYIREASITLGKGVFNKAGAEVVFDQLTDKFSNIKNNIAELSKASEEYIKNGTLSSETYFSLLENGFQDYVDITSDGYVLIEKKAEEAWIAQSLNPLRELENSIETNKRLIEQMEAVDLSNINYDELYVLDDFGNRTSANIKNEKELINYYKEHKRHVEGLNDQYKDIIKIVADAGYTTQNEYNAALKEGQQTMEQAVPDTYIQGLVSITEQMQKSEEAASELKDKIQELNEEYDKLAEKEQDNIESLNEANQALNEAREGTDDFRSGLDGLINYIKPLENIRKNIENVKNELTKVANIDEAKGLLSQLSELENEEYINIGAQNIALQKELANLKTNFEENYGEFIQGYDTYGNPIVDFAYQNMQRNDEFKKAYEEYVTTINEINDTIIENEDKKEEIIKDKTERQEKFLNNFVEVQDDVISILKEQAKEELDITKNKYDALEEADNNYLDALEDAIERQRKLRQQQEQYEDLATKEKKLSLLRRDTSQTNQKEILTLENEVQDDRQNILDNEVDNIIESMRELYEKQKEARDTEIEYMEEVTENAQYFAEWASNIMSTWQSVEDMQSWYLENDPNAQDMTIEQTEVYLDKIGEKYSNYVLYITELSNDFTKDQNELNAAMNEMYSNTQNNIEDTGTLIQENAQKTADELEKEAEKAYEDAAKNLAEIRQEMQDNRDEWSQMQQELQQSEQEAVFSYQTSMDALVEASKSAIEEVSLFATKAIIDFTGTDLNQKEEVLQLAKDSNWVVENEAGTFFNNNLIKIMDDKDYDTSWMTSLPSIEPTSSLNENMVNITKKITEVSTKVQEKLQNSYEKIEVDKQKTAEQKSNNIGYKVIYPPLTIGGMPKTQIYASEDLADAAAKQWNDAYYQGDDKKKKYKAIQPYKHIAQYKTGGLVDYTGPAWVDGTKYKPEAFLNANDTQRIGEAAKILADIPILNSTSSANNAVSTNIGDTSIEIHINVESINSDYDVDQLVERVKQDIVDVSNPIGTPIILRK